MTEKDSSSKNNRSEATKAALLSAFVIPGAGQMYNREWGKGWFMAILFIIASLAVLIPLTYAVVHYIQFTSSMANAASPGANQAPHPLTLIENKLFTLITLIVISLILYVYSIVDAYRRRKNSSC